MDPSRCGRASPPATSAPRQRGTNEAPGSNVKVKTGLNRSLAGVAPAKQTTILLRAGEHRGTRVELS